jgi:FkbM family methyltransferase
MNIDYLDRYFHYDEDIVTESPVFLEIGNYSGGNMKRLLKKFPESTIIIYEASIDGFNSLKKAFESIGSPENVFIHNKAIADKDGEIIFFEYRGKPSSNSVFARHEKKTSLDLESSHRIASTDIEGVMRDNNVSKIDVVFANAEGIEIMILDELHKKEKVRNSVPQLCLSMHERIVGKEAIDDAFKKASQFYSFEKGEGKWACHLFRRKDLVK